jgi:hypothetical protein
VILRPPIGRGAGRPLPLEFLAARVDCQQWIPDGAAAMWIAAGGKRAAAGGRSLPYLIVSMIACMTLRASSAP